MTETWKDSVMDSILNFEQAPESFIPGCFVDSAATGPAITKYRGLFEPQNTPFKVGISLEKTNMVKVHSFYQNDCTLILRFHFPKKIFFLQRISTRPSGGHSGKIFLTKTEVEKKVMKNVKSSKK